MLNNVIVLFLLRQQTNIPESGISIGMTPGVFLNVVILVNTAQKLLFRKQRIKKLGFFHYINIKKLKTLSRDWKKIFVNS